MAHARDKSRRGAAQPSQRQLRVGELIRHALSQVLERGEVHDPEIAGKSITVAEVRMSPDLKVATAYVMPLGGDDAGEDGGTVVAALGRVAPFLRRRIGGVVALKFSPELRFIGDETFDQASRIDELLRDARREDAGEDAGENGSEDGA